MQGVEAPAVAEILVALAKLLGARLALVQAVQPVVMMTNPPLPFPTGFDDELSRVQRREAQDYLDDVVEQLTAQGVPASGAAVLGGGAFDTIQEAARGPRTGVVALATHGRGGVRRLVLGIVADKLVRAGEHPILVTRPRGRGG
jgi:nucleotide-binding universal stress UspA family protein